MPPSGQNSFRRHLRQSTALENTHCGRPIACRSIARDRSVVFRRATSPLNDPAIRIIIIFGVVVTFSLLAALVGCVIACCQRRRRKVSKDVRESPEGGRHGSEIYATHPSESSFSSSPSSDDIEAFASLDGIMSNDTFKGREWDSYKREMRIKARRRARGAMRTSQGIPMPIDVRQLRGRMRALSRSLIRSMTRSDPSAEAFCEPVSLDEILRHSNRKPDAEASGATLADTDTHDRALDLNDSS